MNELQKIEVKNNDGIKAFFWIRPECNDKGIIKEIWKDNVYLNNNYNLNKEDIVIDIGAHIGIFSILACFYGAKVMSFEPYPNNIILFKKNMIENKLKININEVAVGFKEGYEKLWLHESNLGGHSFIKGNKLNFINVKTITLNSILKQVQKCDLLKLDIEGLEYEILYNTNLSKVKKIVMEHHDLNQTRELIKYFKKIGFIIDEFKGMSNIGQLKVRKIK